MLVDFLKFTHLLCVLGLMGTLSYGVTNGSHGRPVGRFLAPLIGLSVLAMLTGTLLVHPKHYTFHTPWIQAAYLLAGLFLLGIIGFSLAEKRYRLFLPHWRLGFGAVFLMVLLMIANDAINKTTFLFG